MQILLNPIKSNFATFYPLLTEITIGDFFNLFRKNWPEERITPKMHILEDHVASFIKLWQVGFGFYGEQGTESLQSSFNKMIYCYSNIKNPVDGVKYMMKRHLLKDCPQAAEYQPSKKKRCNRETYRFYLYGVIFSTGKNGKPSSFKVLESLSFTDKKGV